MQSNTLILTTLTRDELQALVIDSVKVCLKNQTPVRDNTPDEAAPYISKKEAARLISVCVSSIDNAAREGRIERFIMGKVSDLKGSRCWSWRKNTPITNKKNHPMSNKTNAHIGLNDAGEAISDIEMIHKDNATIPISIPENSDLEQPPKTEYIPITGLPEIVFDNLPDLLKNACSILTEQTEKEVFLVGAFGVLSGLLPNVRGFYDGEYCFPNLYVYILGAYGTGKGGLKLARKLGNDVHQKRKELSSFLQEQYKEQCIKAKENKEPEPENPGNKLLFIPANNSKSGIMELMANNDGMGIIFETEGDTLADALKTDFGSFSDVLRKSAHHETVSFYRRTGRELIDIPTPRLSVVLTSTLDQYQRLIPNIHNGLFSRFLHYHLTTNHEFKNVFDHQKKEYPIYFDGLGRTFADMYTVLEGLPEPINFEMREHQTQQFLQVFGAWKKEVGECVTTDLDGAINRLGLICFRLSMILSALRHFGEGDYSTTIICDDTDFENAVRIVDVLKRHALRVYHDLPHPVISKNAVEFEKELKDKAGQIAHAKRLFDSGKSYAEIAKEVLGDVKNKSTVYRWLNR